MPCGFLPKCLNLCNLSVLIYQIVISSSLLVIRGMSDYIFADLFTKVFVLLSLFQDRCVILFLVWLFPNHVMCF